MKPPFQIIMPSFILCFVFLTLSLSSTESQFIGTYNWNSKFYHCSPVNFIHTLLPNLLTALHPYFMNETQVCSMGQKDPLEKGMAIHSSIVAWRIPKTEVPDGLQSLEFQRVRHNWGTNSFTFTLRMPTGPCKFYKGRKWSSRKGWSVAESHTALVQVCHPLNVHRLCLQG